MKDLFSPVFCKLASLNSRGPWVYTQCDVMPPPQAVYLHFLQTTIIYLYENISKNLSLPR